MSQKKVEEYKEEKRNRKEEIAKQKKLAARRKMLGWLAAVLVILCLVAGIVITILNKSKEQNQAELDTYTADEFILDDYANINGNADEAADAE